LFKKIGLTKFNFNFVILNTHTIF